MPTPPFVMVLLTSGIIGLARATQAPAPSHTPVPTTTPAPSINIEAITQDAKTDFILEKMAKLESNTNWLVDRIMRIFPEDK